MLYFSFLFPSLICNGLLKLASTAWLPIVKPVPMITCFFYGTSGARGETRDLSDSDNNAESDPDMREAGVETWQPNRESPVLNLHAKLS